MIPAVLVLAFAVNAPTVGRPTEWPFSGAVARLVNQDGAFVAPLGVSSEVSPTRLDVGEPVTLTVTVRARGPVLRPPGRIDLQEVRAFRLAFFIEDLPDEGPPPAAGAWRWKYQLRPRAEWVSEVPGVPLLYYNPDLGTLQSGYQLLYSDAVPLVVRPEERARSIDDLPDEMLEPATGPAVLAARRPWRGPTLGDALLALLGPPAACGVWYLLWQWAYPDAARQARQRRSRAARRALKALQRLPAAPREQAEHIVTALAGYLAERFDLTAAAPTPDEAAAALDGMDDLAGRLRRAWASADELRFAKEPAARLAADEARQLILDIEERACPPSS